MKMDILRWLLGIAVLCPLAYGHFDVFIPSSSMCDLSSRKICKDYYLFKNGERPRWKTLFFMFLPDVPGQVEKVTFAWRRTTQQQVAYDINITSSDVAVMSAPTFRDAPMQGQLPAVRTDVDLLFHCTGAKEKTAAFIIKACFKDESQRICSKATLRKRCLEEQRFCTLQCYNGGRCLAKYRKEKCICPTEYAGRQCERRKFVKTHKTLKWCPFPCSKEGTRYCSAEKRRCYCKTRFKGAFCQNKVKLSSPCNGVCLYGGVCNLVTRTCQCRPGYVGPFCHINKNPRAQPTKPPKVFAISTRLRVLSGEDTRISCLERNTKNLNNTWYFVDGENSQQPLTHTMSQRISINRAGDLVIKKVTVADMGEYICLASDAYRRQWRVSTFLQVEAAPANGSGSGREDDEDTVNRESDM